MNPLVSIILPTYNVDRFLLKCLESIESQTYKNIEVIVIIDGATDNSYSIAKSFCSIRENFNVYWQENQGSGPARNNGLLKAKGELIVFVDPDDWCEPNYVENMVCLQMKGDYDLVISKDINAICTSKGDILQYNKTKGEYLVCNSQLQVRQNYASLLTSDLISSPHAKMYKKSIIDGYSVSFPDLRRSQDIAFNYRYYSNISSYCISPDNGYVYRIIPDERNARIRKDYYHTISLLFKDIKSMYKKWGVVFDSEAISNHFFIRLCGYFYLSMSSANEIEKIMTDATLKELVKEARPSRIDRKICKFLLGKQEYFLSAIMIKVFSVLKRLQKSSNY